MTTQFRQALLAVALLTATSLCGDTIVLKNGRRIYADRTREANGKLEYEVGDNTFSISKSLVDHVEGGGTPPPSSGSSSNSASALKLSFSTPSGHLANEDDVSSKVVKNGQVDLQGLSEMVRPGGTPAAAAYFVAGKVEYEHGNFERAQQYLISALGYMPNQPVILDQLALVLGDMHRFGEALPYAQQAVMFADRSADAHAVLGYIYFNNNRTREAIAEFKKSLAIHPTANVQSMLDFAQRESTAESSFAEQVSSHFNFHFEGGATPPAFRAQLVRTLEGHYDELARVFGASPRQNISVSLYSEEAFFDVTRAPDWTAAQNDGKLRIPVEGLTSVTPELSRVLKHELAHSFISEMTRNRCPVWLHEGIAQYVEGESLRPAGSALSAVYAANRQVPMQALEGSFFGLDGRQATIAYTESLAAVDYIVNTYGMSDVVRILRRLGDGASTDEALRGSIHSSYSSLDSEIGMYLKKTYGN